MSEDLESALRDLGAHLDVPAPPDMTTAVLSRLDEKPDRWPVRRLVAAAVAAAVVLATAMAVSPTVRAAVYDLLRIGSVEIHENEQAPVSLVPPVDAPLPGERDVSLFEARDLADFPLRLPSALGLPETVRLVDDGRVVSLAYATPHGQVRVDEFAGGLDPMFRKFTSDKDVHHVTVADRPAVWINQPHVVIYTDHNGKTHQESARLAGSTLIWDDNGVTYRIEGALTEQEATEIAESLH